MNIKVKHLWECPHCHEEMSMSDNEDDTYTRPEDASYAVYLWCNNCEKQTAHYFEYNSSSTTDSNGLITDLGKLDYDDGLSLIERWKDNIINNYYIHKIERMCRKIINGIRVRN